MYTGDALKPKDIGIAVNKFQGYLNLMQERGFITTHLVQDGVFGSRMTMAVKEFQKYAGLEQDGMIGNATWDAIVNKLRSLNIVTNIPVASRNYFLAQGNRGIDVFKMQEYINEIAAKNSCLRPIPVDGIFTNRMTMAIQMFQYLYNLSVDGVIGKNTWDAIVNERNKLTAM